MAKRRLGRRERAELRALQAAGMMLVNGVPVKFNPDVSDNARSLTTGNFANLWPINKPCRKWEWDWKVHRRIKNQGWTATTN
jgi:hypothetical protein